MWTKYRYVKQIIILFVFFCRLSVGYSNKKKSKKYEKWVLWLVDFKISAKTYKQIIGTIVFLIPQNIGLNTNILTQARYVVEYVIS